MYSFIIYKLQPRRILYFYIYEKGVQTRINDSESGNCESESNTIDESNYPICHLSYDGGLPFQPQ